MLVTLFGIVTLVSPVHLEKADEPMLVTLSGMSIDFMFVLSLNTLLFIV